MCIQGLGPAVIITVSFTQAFPNKPTLSSTARTDVVFILL
jgi:hypothetical protein